MVLDTSQILNGFAVIFSFWLGYRIGAMRQHPSNRIVEKNLSSKSSSKLNVSHHPHHFLALFNLYIPRVPV